MTNIFDLLMKRNKTLTPHISLISLLLTLGFSNISSIAQASTAQTAPPELKNLLTQIDTAASQGKVKEVMQFYSPNFTHGDGLNRETMEKSLTSLWGRYPQLRYNTTIQSWKTQGNAIIAETVTNISSLPSPDNNNLALKATIKSRQRLIGQKIVRQDILSELTQVSFGTKPPEIEIKLPQQVKVGQKYNFDAIVQEPLGDDFLLGTALEEPIQAGKFLNPTSVNLELLPAGGLFKEGRAPSVPGNQWVSAVILRGDGMTMITQRLQVVKK
ncbi:nuclear transport factor 2 family protein [Cronbergia sp. UHCC 0137]|uniref:nuclear transport factor 2 family protein n=1 Tax=Cronbergia sp. UHCC 0137 TaxID=3110239 RepID=UPI002B1E9CA6|nr:nuclear transport factor 2 family protein [Cronbergia sp. UHCC 0137]MEA5620727.1 nuclear transport factor 2 family protein [Cronbergia sp. UHCC 0137]